MVPTALRVPLPVLWASSQGRYFDGSARRPRTLARARRRGQPGRTGAVRRFVFGTAPGARARSHRGTPLDYGQRLSAPLTADWRGRGRRVRRALPRLAAAVVFAPDDWHPRAVTHRHLR